MGSIGESLRELVRAIRADLVDQRLLPLVIVLAIAVVAVPVAFSLTKAGTASGPSAPIVPGGPGALIPAQATDKTNSALGPVHNPFGNATSTTPSATTGAAGPVTARTPTATTPASTTPSATGLPTPSSTLTPTPTVTHRTSTEALQVWHVDYSFGQGVSAKTYRNALRLDAKPSNTAPVVQYLGVTRHGRAAAFLIYNASSVSGDGTCVNGQTPCQIVLLKAGGTEFLEVPVQGAGTVQFELNMLGIHARKAASASAALRAHLAQSAAGVALIKQSKAQALAKFSYSTRLGVLLRKAA